MPLTQGYIDGCIDLHQEVSEQINGLLKKHDVNTQKGLVDVVNGIIGYMYYLKSNISEMKAEYEKQRDTAPNPFEETPEQIVIQFGTGVRVTSTGTQLKLVVHNKEVC